MTESKTCTKCNELKNIENFELCQPGKPGRRSKCRKCVTKERTASNKFHRECATELATKLEAKQNCICSECDTRKPNSEFLEGRKVCHDCRKDIRKAKYAAEKKLALKMEISCMLAAVRILESSVLALKERI